MRGRTPVICWRKRTLSGTAESFKGTEWRDSAGRMLVSAASSNSGQEGFGSTGGNETVSISAIEESPSASTTGGCCDVSGISADIGNSPGAEGGEAELPAWLLNACHCSTTFCGSG